MRDAFSSCDDELARLSVLRSRTPSPALMLVGRGRERIQSPLLGSTAEAAAEFDAFLLTHVDSSASQLFMMPDGVYDVPEFQVEFQRATDRVEAVGESLNMPPGSIESRPGGGLTVALSDNGASWKTNCARTLDGAIMDTYCAEDAGDMAVGDQGATLESHGSYVYVQ